MLEVERKEGGGGRNTKRINNEGISDCWSTETTQKWEFQRTAILIKHSQVKDLPVREPRRWTTDVLPPFVLYCSLSSLEFIFKLPLFTVQELRIGAIYMTDSLSCFLSKQSPIPEQAYVYFLMCFLLKRRGEKCRWSKKGLLRHIRFDQVCFLQRQQENAKRGRERKNQLLPFRWPVYLLEDSFLWTSIWYARQGNMGIFDLRNTVNHPKCLG